MALFSCENSGIDVVSMLGQWCACIQNPPFSIAVHFIISHPTCYYSSLFFSLNNRCCEAETKSRTRWCNVNVYINQTELNWKPPDLESSDKVMLLNEYQSNSQVLRNRLTKLGCVFPPSNCKILFQEWSDFKPNLVLVGSKLDEVDRISYLGGCISPSGCISDVSLHAEGSITVQQFEASVSPG